MDGREGDAAREDELRQVRAALEDAVRRRSLRHVARQAGMSPSGLRGVIVGTVPYGKTWEKLRLWYATAHPEAQRAPPPATILELLRMLLRAVPERKREEAIRRVLDTFAAAYVEADAPLPPWLPGVRALLAEAERRAVEAAAGG